MADRYTKIGIVQKPIGIKGEVKIDIEDDFLEDLVESDHIFLCVNGSFVPWFIEELRETNYIILKLEEVDTPEKAAKFNLHDIFLRTGDISSESFSQKQEKEGWVGYVIVQDDKVIGYIENIVEYPQQLMASVRHQGKEVLIPLTEAYIEGIDDRTKTLKMQLPDGLLDL